MHSTLRDIFNAIEDGVLVVGTDSNLRFLNRGAEILLGPWGECPLDIPGLKPLLKAAVDGTLRLPHRTLISLPPHHSEAGGIEGNLEVSLQRSPVADEFVLVMRDRAAEQLYRNAFSNLRTLIDHDCQSALETFRSALEALMQELSAVGQTRTKGLIQAQSLAMERGSSLLELARRLCDIVEATSDDDIGNSDRINPLPVLREVIEQVSTLAVQRRVRIVFAEPTGTTGTLFGSRLWLKRALIECLDNAVRYSKPDHEISVTLKQRDTFLMITITNENSGLSPLVKRFGLLPLYKVVPYPRPTDPQLGIGLAVAHRLIKRLNGNLELNQKPGGFLTCRIELPTGGVEASSQGSSQEQAERFAQDFVALIRERSTTI